MSSTQSNGNEHTPIPNEESMEDDSFSIDFASAPNPMVAIQKALYKISLELH